MAGNERRTSKKTGLSTGDPAVSVRDKLSHTVKEVLASSGPRSLEAADWAAKTGRYVSAEALAVVIEANPDRPFPEALRRYLCRFLRGEVQRKRGPKRTDQYLDFVTEFLANEFYREELARLQQTPRPRGREGLAQGISPAHKEAIRLVQEKFPARFGKLTPERVANILSSHN